MADKPLTIDGNDTGYGWEVFMDTPGAQDCPPLAQCIHVPVPRVGETLFLEPCNGPLVVKRVEWDMRDGYPLMALVIVG